MSPAPGLPAAALAAALAERRHDLRAARLADWLARGGSSDDLRTALLTALTNPVAETRRRTTLLLPDLPAPVGPFADSLRAALADPAWVVREAAAVAAGRLPDRTGDELIGLLVERTLRDSHPLVRRAAAVAVGPRIEPRRDYGEAIRHPFERQRMRAAFALGHVAAGRAAESASLLAVAVADSHAKVRRTALEALTGLPHGAVRPLIPTVVRKCAEADPNVAAAARCVWERFLATPLGEPLRPLQPYPGTANRTGLRLTVTELPDSHPLRDAWNAIAPPEDPSPTPYRLARVLGQLCGRVLGPG